jgi:hypothetical protein
MPIHRLAALAAVALAVVTVACSSSPGASSGSGPSSKKNGAQDGGTVDGAADSARGQPPADTGTSPPGDSAVPDTSTLDSTTPDGSGGGTVGGIPGGQAGPGTTLSGCQIFPPDNPWNVRIDGPNVQVVSASTYAQIPQSPALHADFGDFSTDGYGIPYAVVNAAQPNVQVTFGCFADQSDPGVGGWTTPPAASSADCSGEGSSNELGVTTYPFFTGIKIEGNPAAGSGGTPGALPNDQHVLVLQQGASGCVAWEAWNCVQNPAPFNCANGAKFDLTSNAPRPAGWTSADAAGLSILAGLVRLADVQAGTITHAIRVTFQQTQAGYIPPATHASGSEALGSAYPPMGLRLRLKSSVAISGYPAPAQVVLKAMQQYGLIVADIGSNWYFSGDSDDGWNAMATDGQDTWLGEIASGTGQMHGSDFEVVNTGAPVNTGL